MASTKPWLVGEIQNETPRVLAVIANGSEEIEVVVTVDSLRRAGFEVTLASVEKSTQIRASRDVVIVADTLLSSLSQKDLESYHCIFIPGGGEGSKTMSNCSELIDIIKMFNESKKTIAAICAAPAKVLGKNNILGQHQVTCYPDEKLIKILGENYRSSPDVLTDGHFITAQGPAQTFNFALSIIARLGGVAKTKEVAKALLL